MATPPSVADLQRMIGDGAIRHQPSYAMITVTDDARSFAEHMAIVVGNLPLGQESAAVDAAVAMARFLAGRDSLKTFAALLARAIDSTIQDEEWVAGFEEELSRGD